VPGERVFLLDKNQWAKISEHAASVCNGCTICHDPGCIQFDYLVADNGQMIHDVSECQMVDVPPATLRDLNDAPEEQVWLVQAYAAGCDQGGMRQLAFPFFLLDGQGVRVAENI